MSLHHRDDQVSAIPLSPAVPTSRNAVPRSLAAISEIAGALANGESLAAIVPGALSALASELDGAQASLWLRGLDGLRRAWSVGNDTTTANAVDALLDPGLAPDSADATVAWARLIAGRRQLGAITVRPGRALSAEDRVFLGVVADVLAPALRDAEHAHRLESEVAERTREADQERRFTEHVIDALPVGLYVIDRSYRIQLWNRKRETGLQGVSREEAIGRTIFEILHRQPAELLRSEFESVFETGRIQQFTIESSATGESRTYRLTKIPMRFGDGGITHIITIGEDITDWRQAQDRFAQAEKLAAVGTLAAGVMHEINNPLATISACAEALAAAVADGAGNAGVGDSLSLIQAEVQRCKLIIDGLLDFSRPQATSKTRVDLATVIDKTLGLVKHHPRFRRVTIDIEPLPSLPSIDANEEQMVQLFLALLTNALDAIADEGVVTLRARPGEGNTVVTEVVDRGVGIRSSDRAKIFEPFYTTKGPRGGSGLGLSICYAIVTDHGGRIEVDSVLGEGSVFRIVLPAIARGDAA